MKTSKTVEDSLGALTRVNTTGDVRHLIATAMLAKLRGELTNHRDKTYQDQKEQRR